MREGERGVLRVGAVQLMCHELRKCLVGELFTCFRLDKSSLGRKIVNLIMFNDQSSTGDAIDVPAL